MELRQAKDNLKKRCLEQKVLLKRLGVLFCVTAFGVGNLSADFNTGFRVNYDATKKAYPEEYEHDSEVEVLTFNIAANSMSLASLESAIFSKKVKLPDIICLQEISSVQVHAFAQRHPELNVSYVGADNYVTLLNTYNGNAIISPYKMQDVTTERFDGDIQAVKGISSGMRHLNPEKMAQESYKEKRAAIAATVQIPLSNKQEVAVRISNTHIDGGSLKWRQRRAFGKFMTKQEGYQVDIQAFCGDLNATNRQDVITMVSWAKENIPPSDPTSTDDKRRIDYIGFRQTEYGFDRHLGVATLKNTGSIKSIKSDHYASLLTVEFEQPQGPDARKIPHRGIS